MPILPKRICTLRSYKTLLPNGYVRYLSTSRSRSSGNRVYSPIRNEEEFNNIMLLSSSSRQALITLWTASWCRTCKTVSPFVNDLVSSDDLGQGSSMHEGDVPPVGFAEVEMDAPDMAEVVSRYRIRSIPMLLSFSRGEPQMSTSVTDARKLTDKAFLTQWLITEARREGRGGAGGSLFGRIFG